MKDKSFTPKSLCLPLLDKTNANSIDVEQVKQMVDAFIEKGFTYFDTTWMYCAFNSESTAKTVLADRYPRKTYTLATRLNAGFIDSLEDRDKIFDQQMQKTGVTYFESTDLLVQAHRALGILEGMTKYIPNVEHFLEMMICKILL